MRFEVSLNGKSLCICGLDGYGQVMVSSDFSRTSPEYGAETSEGTLSISGLDASIPGELRVLIWFNGKIEEGDEITVKVLRDGMYDSPERSMPFPAVRPRQDLGF